MDALLNGTPMQLVNGGSNRRCYTYIDDAVECCWRIVQNPGGVCDRQILNIGSPHNEISIRKMAETMREIYAAEFRQPGEPLSAIVSVTGEEFYGAGYDDSDRRIPDIAKARTLLGWEPVWPVRDILETTMRYYVEETRKAKAQIA
jgi:nucleoside-diphosphate-sugar epimerase